MTHSSLPRVSLYVFYGLLAYMPLHIFVSTVIGANLGILTVAKVLKDIILLGGFLALVVYSSRQRWFRDWLSGRLTIIIIAYALFTVVKAAVSSTDLDAEILGVTYNLRFLVMFLYATLLTRYFPLKDLRSRALSIILAVGAVVVTFGIFQYTLLPNDALTHLGFTRENGVLPAFFIDDKPDLERVMSTVRDPNSLGSYLIILIPLLAVQYLVVAKSKHWWLIYGLASLICIYFTFSRSAWLGVVLSGLTLGYLLLKNRITLTPRQVKLMVILIVGLSSVTVLTLFTARDTYFVKNVIFHADESTTLEDPNQLRVRFFQESIQNVLNNPNGSGPGTAGLASIRNDVQGTELNENYYLQIATEVGLLGLVLFLVILMMVARKLYLSDSQGYVTYALLASFVGLAFTNFLVHIWSNEAVAYTWWGLAGLYIPRKNLR